MTPPRATRLSDRAPMRGRPEPLPRSLALLALCVMVVAAACETVAPVQSLQPTTAAVATVEVSPEGVLLTGLGETRVLTATARSAAGEVVPAVVTWSSSDAAVASVDSSGTVQAAAAVGNATVIAAVGEIQSLPTYVTVAQPVAGAVLLSDEQIISGPTSVDPPAEPAPDAAYEVVLRGVTGAVPGAILINADSLPVAGRVISTTPEGGDQRVRLVVVPPGELFTAVSFSDTVDLAEGPFEVPADLAAAYEVTQTGSSFVFTPKPGAIGRASTFGAGNAALASWVQPRPHGASPLAAPPVGTTALPPLPPFNECEASAEFGSGLPMPLSISAPPAFAFNAAGTATRALTPAGTKIVVSATPTFTFLAALEVRSAFEAKIGCTRTLATRKFRVPGWAGLFFGGDVNFGVGFEVAGKVTLFGAKVGGTAELKPTFTATLDCPTGSDCTLSGDASTESKFEPVLDAPSINQGRFEPSVNLFAFLGLEAGNADLESLQFKAIEAKAGLELGASLTLEGLQIDNTHAELGRSKYGLAFKGEVGPGIKLGELLAYLGLAEVVPLKLGFELALGESPTGTVQADKRRYLPGEPVEVTVTLAPASTVFPSLLGIYNVRRVVILRRDGLSPVFVAEQDATDGTTEFQFAFDAPVLLNAEELYAFVVTRLLPLDPPRLEIGQAVPRGQAYTNDFNAATSLDGGEWAGGRLAVSPSGERFLGRFGDGHTAGLTLAGLAPHATVTVEFDIYVIGTWDGNDNSPPDYLDIEVLGGTPSHRVTFSHDDNDCQSWPDDYPACKRYATGRQPINLGYGATNNFFDPDNYGNGVYHATYTFQHSTPDLVFTIGGAQSGSDEQWGIDNIRVTVAP